MKLTLDEYLELLEKTSPFSRADDPLTIALLQASERTAVEIKSQIELSAIAGSLRSNYPFSGWAKQAGHAAKLMRLTLAEVEKQYVVKSGTEEGRQFFIRYLEDDANRLRTSVALYESLARPFNAAQAPLVALIRDFSTDARTLFIDDESQIETLKLIQRLRDEYFFTLELPTLVTLTVLISDYLPFVDYNEEQLSRAHGALDQLETFIMLAESKLT